MPDDHIQVQITATTDKLQAALQESVQAVQDRFGQIAASAEQMSDQTKAATDQFSQMPPSLGPVISKLGEMASGAGKAGAAIGTVIKAAEAGYGILKNFADAENQINNIKVSTEFTTGIKYTADELEKLKSQLASLPGVTSEMAGQVLDSYTRMSHATKPEIEALVAMTADYAQATNRNVVTASANLAQAFSYPLQNVVAFVGGLKNVTDAQRENATQAQKSGNANLAAAAMLDALNTSLDAVRPAMDQNNANMLASIGNILTYVGASQEAMTVQEIHTDLVSAETIERVKQTEQIRKLIEAQVELGRVQKQAAAAQKTVTPAEGAQTPQAQSGSAELEAIKQSTQQILAIVRQSADQQIAIERNKSQAIVVLNNQTTQSVRSGVAQSAAVAAAGLQAQQATEQAYYARRAEQAKADLAAGKITLEQERDTLVEIENEKYAAEKKYYDQKWAAAENDAVKQTALWGEIATAYEAHLTHLAQLDQRYFEKQKHEVQQEGQAWRGVIQEIGGAEDTLVRDIFTKRQSLARSLIQMSSELLQKEIADDLKYYTTKLLYNALGLQDDQKTSQGGMLVHLIAELMKTSATATGNAARTESNVIAAEMSGSADSGAASSSIFKHAASAAAAVYDDVAQIPYVGWILAPIAAAAAFTAVAAFGDMIPSAAGGMVVGGDGLIMAHAQEMVIPASISTGLRDIISAGSFAGAGSWRMPSFAGAGSFSSSSSDGGSSGAAGVNVTFAPQVSALDARSVVALFNNPSIMRQFAKNLGAYMTANPSARPAY